MSPRISEFTLVRQVLEPLLKTLCGGVPTAPRPLGGNPVQTRPVGT